MSNYAYECNSYSFIVLCVLSVICSLLFWALAPYWGPKFVLTKREIIAMSNTFFKNQNILHIRHTKQTVYDQSMSVK